MPKQSLIAMGSACIGEAVMDTRLLDNACGAQGIEENQSGRPPSIGTPIITLNNRSLNN